jgi:hypothetical protein
MKLVTVAGPFCPHDRAWPLDAAKLACMAYRIHRDNVAVLKLLHDKEVCGAPVIASC